MAKITLTCCHCGSEHLVCDGLTRNGKQRYHCNECGRSSRENPAASDLELDELWSFVLKRANKRWVWIALCRATRQVVAYVVVDRSAATCRKLWGHIPAAYRSAHCYTDFWEAYQTVLPAEQHTAAGKETGLTAHVERWNNTLRQRLGRFVRKSLSFFKSEEMHEICLRLFLHRYNSR
ncbi:MAG: IS1 family transposase [Pyrinomonadaceae bacterium]